MSVLQAEVYEAFRVPDDKALKAAIALSAALSKVEDATTRAFAKRDVDAQASFSKRDADIEAIRREMTSVNLRMAALVGDMNLMKWMTGTLIAGVVTVIFRVFTH